MYRPLFCNAFEFINSGNHMTINNVDVGPHISLSVELSNEDDSPLVTVTFVEKDENGHYSNPRPINVPVILSDEFGTEVQSNVLRDTLLKEIYADRLIVYDNAYFVRTERGAKPLADADIPDCLFSDRVLYFYRRRERVGKEDVFINTVDYIRASGIPSPVANKIRRTIKNVAAVLPKHGGRYMARCNISRNNFSITFPDSETELITSQTNNTAIKKIMFFERISDNIPPGEQVLSELCRIFAASDTNIGRLKSAFILAALSRCLFIDRNTAFTPAYPLIVITASEAGAGKTSLAICLSRIGGGDNAILSGDQLSNGDELTKLIVSGALAGQRVFVLDNVSRGMMLRSGVLASASTGQITGRILGKSSHVTIPSPLFILTGLDLSYGDELGRRALRIDMEKADPEDEVTLFGQTMSRRAAIKEISHNQDTAKTIASSLLRYVAEHSGEMGDACGNFDTLGIANAVLRDTDGVVVNTDIDSNASSELLHELTEIILNKFIEADENNEEHFVLQPNWLFLVDNQQPIKIYDAGFDIAFAHPYVLDACLPMVLSKAPFEQSIVGTEAKNTLPENVINEYSPWQNAPRQITEFSWFGLAFRDNDRYRIRNIGPAIYDDNHTQMLIHGKTIIPLYNRLIIVSTPTKLILRIHPSVLLKAVTELIMTSNGDGEKIVSGEKITYLQITYPILYRHIRNLVGSGRMGISSLNVQWLVGCAASATPVESITYSSKRDGNGKRPEITITFTHDRFMNVFKPIIIKPVDGNVGFRWRSRWVPLGEVWLKHADPEFISRISGRIIPPISGNSSGVCNNKSNSLLDASPEELDQDDDIPF